MLLQTCEEKWEEQLMDNFSNSQEGIQEKGKHFFLYLHSMKKRIEFMYEVLLEFDLINAEDVRFAEEKKKIPEH